MIWDALEVAVTRFLGRDTNSPTRAARKRAHLAYAAAWSAKSPTPTEELAHQFKSYDVPRQYADPESGVGSVLYEAIRDGRSPRWAKEYLL